MLRKVTLVLAILLSASASLAEERMTLSLEQAHELLREHSPALNAAARSVEAATAGVQEMRAQRWPKLTLSAGYNRVNEVAAPSINAGPLGTFQLGETVTNYYSTQAAVTYPVFTGFRLENAEHAARHLEQAAIQDREATLSTTSASVTEAYWRLHGARTAERTMTESVRLVEALLEDVQSLRRAGMATLDDELTISLRHSEVRLAAIEAEHRSVLVQAGLASLLSQPLTTQIALADSPHVGAVDIPVLDSLLTMAHRNRPELRAIQERIHAAERQTAAEKGGRLPSVMLSGSYTVANPNQRYFPTEAEWNDSWAVGVGVSWTAWDWGVVKRRTERAHAETARAEQNLRFVQQHIELEVMQQHVATIESGRRIAVAQENVRQAQEHFRVAQVAFRAGTSSSTEVLDAQTSLTNARMSLVLARVDQQIALSRLGKAVGGSLR